MYEAAENTNARLEEECLGDRREKLKDFWTEATPALQEASSRSMRVMVVELAVNTGRSDDIDAALVEAAHALRLLSGMDHLTGSMFAWLCRDHHEADPALEPLPIEGPEQITSRCQGPYLILTHQLPYHHVPFHMWRTALCTLKS